MINQTLNRLRFLVGVICCFILVATAGASEKQATVDAFPLPLIDVSLDARLHKDAPTQSAVPEQNDRFFTEPFVPLQLIAAEQVGHRTVQPLSVHLANYESETRRFDATMQLPAEVEPILNKNDGWRYERATHTLQWGGRLEGANLSYSADVRSQTLPYIDLGEYEVPNLCGDAGTEQPLDCDNVTREFNLGRNNDYTLALYGEALGTIAVNSNGLLLAGRYQRQLSQADKARWLPSQQARGHLLAPLWRDHDLSESGRFHAAILKGYHPEGDVFYAQWHDVPHSDDVNATARFAAAIVINGSATGDLFYIYENIADIKGVVDGGYVIGLQDHLGQRGYTFAYAGNEGNAQGVPPEGVTLQFSPTLQNQNAAYRVELPLTLFMAHRSTALVPLTVTVQTDSDSAAWPLFWQTHYFSIRYLSYLPLAVHNGS